VTILAGVVCGLVPASFAINLAGLFTVRAFVRRAPLTPGDYPPVTILKPVCGPEPGLAQALGSFCAQCYPGPVQIVIGAHDPADTALDAARAVQQGFPQADITILADPVRRGCNGKIANLMNMLPHARHDVLVIADSDLTVAPDYLAQVIAALLSPGTGLVTTLPAGEAVVPGIPSQLGASHLADIFVPGVLLGEALGRQDCLGGTMALTRAVLDRIGGFAALADHLADDNVLGRKVQSLGMEVRIAATLPAISVQERSFRELWQHELRWARTVASVAPLSAAGAVLQYPVFLSLLLCIASGGAVWALWIFAAAWAARALIARCIAGLLARRRPRPAVPTPVWLLPVRECLSVAEIVVGFCGDTVVWRGRTLHTRSPDENSPARNDCAGFPLLDEAHPAAPEPAPGLQIPCSNAALSLPRPA
jgi:ceramide glucosyltransferase